MQGQFDSHLDEVGLAQAGLAGRTLREHWSVDRVVSSSLQRTRQTAAAAGLGHLPTTIDDRWQEVDFGAYDDRRIADVMQDLGAAWLADVEYVPPGGESLAGLHRRVGDALADLAEEVQSSTVLVVTHATPVKSAVAWLLGGDAEMIMRLRVNLASLTVFEVSPHGLLLNKFNWTPARGLDGSRAGLSGALPADDAGADRESRPR